jgi:uncharacterized protein YqgQ
MLNFKKKGKNEPKLQQTREITEINKEYGELCAQVGQKNYTIEVMKAELDVMYRRIQELNVEAAKIPTKELEPKKPEETNGTGNKEEPQSN